MEPEQDPDIGGDTLAALEAKPDGKKMTGKGGKTGDETGCLAAQRLHDEDRDRSLHRIGEKGQGRELLVAGAQYIGGADIAGADGPDIAMAGPAGEQQSEGNGT